MRLFPILRLLSLVFVAGASSSLGGAQPSAASNSANEAGPAPEKTLDPVVATAPRYQSLSSIDIPRGQMRFLLRLEFANIASNPYFILGQGQITNTRAPEVAAQVPATLTFMPGATLRSGPTLAVAEALRGVPAFAAPSAGGVALRGVSPSGTDRVLALMDGVPLNDPFTGNLAWAKVPREGLGGVEIVPGGGASAWGQGALSGAVQFFAQPAKGKLVIVDEPPKEIAWGSRGEIFAHVLVGELATRSAEVALTRPQGAGVVQFFARDFRSDGFHLVAPEQRGRVDSEAWSRHRWGGVRWRKSLNAVAELMITARAFEESQGLGTPYQRSAAREKFISVQADGTPDSFFSWSAVAYFRDQSSAQTTSAVNATRTTETPVSDQFAVPAAAAGGSWIATRRHAEFARTSGGFDVRHVRGESRERFAYSAGDFTRLRFAGGAQTTAGAFLTHQQPVSPEVRLTAGGRVDLWRDNDGHRHETDRASGALLRSDMTRSRGGVEVSPSVGLVWQPRKAWRVHGNMQRAYRRPTLNELYQPTTRSADFTEADPTLGTEHNLSGDLGAEWTPAAVNARKAKLFALGATVFWNELRDAVGEIAVAPKSRQRISLERVRVQGAEIAATWNPTSVLTLESATLFSAATVREGTNRAPELTGKRLPHVPRQTTTVGATLRLPLDTTLSARVRWVGRQFEDVENRLSLRAVAVGDVGVSRAVGKNLEVYLNAENIGNARVEAARSADGLARLGAPRMIFGGARFHW